jgi:epoxyqueuosine reductase
MKSKLKALGRFIWDNYRHDLKVFVDTAPLMEKPAAQAAGTGWQGKHTNLVSRQFGSWLFLGELLLSAELPYDQHESDHCGQCRACLDTCPPRLPRLTASMPGAAFSISPSSMRPIDDLRPLLINRIMAATTAWPPARGTSSPRGARGGLHAQTRPHRSALADSPAGDAAFRRRFAGTAIKRIGRDRFVRNVAYALGNSGAPQTSLPAIKHLLNDDSALVRDAAAWALSRLT